MIDPQIKLLAQTAFLALQDIKAKDLHGLDLEPIQSYADFVFVASGSNTRQTQTLADSVQKKIFEVCKRHPLGTEGYQFGQWILVDYGDVICHIFLDETREIYKLEDMWSEITPMNEDDLEFYFTGKKTEKPVEVIQLAKPPKISVKPVKKLAKAKTEKPKKVIKVVKKTTKPKAVVKKVTAKTKKPIKSVKKSTKTAVKKVIKKIVKAKTKPIAKKTKTPAKKSVTKVKKPLAKNKKPAKAAKRKK